MKLTNTYLGFTDKFNPIQKAKIEKILDKKLNYTEYGIYSRKEIVLKFLQEGRVLEYKENVLTYNKRTGEANLPKNEYRLKDNINNYFMVVTKTEYDFAKYLINNNLTNEQNINEFIIAEQKIEEERQEQERRQKEEEKEQFNNQEKEREWFKDWLTEQARKYDNQENIEIARQIYFDTVGMFDEIQVRRLLVLIDNIDNQKCRLKLIDWLHSHNKASKKIFFHITGIKLHDTNRETFKVLSTISKKDFQGKIAYTKKSKENNSDNTDRKNAKSGIKDTFYKSMHINGSHKWEEVFAEKLNIYGLELFITKNEYGYSVSEARSGQILVNADKKKNIKTEIEKIIGIHGIDEINKKIDTVIDVWGISPKYIDIAI